jgi:branched-chain amino acid transport system substrate-binding protein
MVHQTRLVFLLLWVCMVSAAHYTKGNGDLQTPCGAHVKIAFLVPLSGPHAKMGEKLIETAQRALFESRSTEHLVLYPLDTHKKITLAEEALSLNPSLIIGPVFAEDARILQPVTQVPAFTLSNDQTLLDGSLVDGSIFVMGFSPQEETTQIITFALKKNLKRFVALLPDNSYGHAVDSALKECLKQDTGTSVHTIFYSSKDTHETIEGWSRTIRQMNPQALFIPDGSALAQKILSTLQFMGDKTFRHIQLLGLSQWDRPGLLKNASLKGLWFTAYPLRKANSALTPLETLVYDITTMIGDVHHTLRKHSLTKEDFLNPKGFKGTHGRFVLKADGSTTRTWQILEHTGQGAKETSYSNHPF